MNSDLPIHSLLKIAILAEVVATAFAIVAACAYPHWLYAAVGLTTLMITLMPLLILKTYDYFSPWSFVLLAVVTGCTLQSICMTLNWPDEQAIDGFFLLSQEPEYFFYPASIFLLGFACFTVGYFYFGKAERKPITVKRDFNRNNLILVLTLGFVFSSVASIAYIRFTGGAESGQISQKRTLIKTTDVGSDDDFAQYGTLKQISKLTGITFLVLYSFFLSRHENLNSTQFAMIGIFFLGACLIPFYSSMRAPIIWLVLAALGVTYYLDRKRFMSRLFVLTTVGLVFFVAMSMLRNAGNENKDENALQRTVRKLAFNRNGPGFAKTAHIINHIPDTLDYQYGQTIAVWLIAPVPRELFPGKPMVHAGPIIGRAIYNTHVSGVPPGLIAELYWNFHIPGVIFGMLFIGWLLRAIYSWFRNCIVDPAIIIPIYLFSVIPVGYSVIGHSLGFGSIMRFVDFLMISIVVYLCTGPLVQQPQTPQQTAVPTSAAMGTRRERAPAQNV